MIKIDTQQIEEAAAELNQMNQNLSEILQRSQKVVASLDQNWQGEACQVTQEAYDLFAKKFFTQYTQLLAGYVSFLREVVIPNYSEVEQNNITMGKHIYE